MDNETKAWLYDILNAINEIESFYIDQKKEFAVYCVDIKTKRAVERNIEIIGEAMNRVLRKDNEVAITNSRKLVDVRNRIIHGYDSVSDEIIWAIVLNIYQFCKQKSKLYLENKKHSTLFWVCHYLGLMLQTWLSIKHQLC